jgi:hypothetical protein
VFTVNAKNLTGKVWVAPERDPSHGHKTDYIRVDPQATRASKLLSAAVGSHVTARPVLAILADDWTLRGKPAEVFVGAPRAVKDWLRRLPPEMSVGDVTTIAAAVAKPTTWASL